MTDTTTTSSPSTTVSTQDTQLPLVNIEVNNIDHNKLEGRDLSDQHPISAITGLSDEIKTISDSIENTVSESKIISALGISTTNVAALTELSGANTGDETRETILEKISTTGVSAGTYTNADLTIDSYGRITKANNGAAQAAYCTTAATKTSSASPTCPAVVVENYVDGKSWYRVWSDGWIEQGGYYNNSGNSDYGNRTITFLKPFSNSNYNFKRSSATQSTSTVPGSTFYSIFLSTCYYSKTNSSITCQVDGNTFLTGGFDWSACGY